MKQNSKPPHFYFTDMVGNFDGTGALIEQWLKNTGNLRDHAPLEQLVVLTNPLSSSSFQLSAFSFQLLAHVLRPHPPEPAAVRTPRHPQ